MEKLNLSRFGPVSERSYDPKTPVRTKADIYNQTEGKLTGMDCRKCRNRGNIAIPKEDGGIVIVECDCMNTRRSLRKMEESGLKKAISEMSFEQFRTAEAWQEHIKARCMAYAEKPEGWLLLCGQVGSGKTHLCTAVCRYRLQKGDAVRYMPWRDDIARLKALSLDSTEQTKS